MSPLVSEALARVVVESLDRSLPLYEALCPESTTHRFTFRAVRLAWVGCFLVIEPPAEDRERYMRTATLHVDDIEAARRIVEAHGGVCLEGPAGAPNGPRMIAQHPDGCVFEYIALDRSKSTERSS